MREPHTEGSLSRRLVGVGFVLAVLSLVLGVLTAIPALIIGVLAAVRGRGRAGAAIILLALLLPLATFAFLQIGLGARSFRMPSESMEPTLHGGDRFVATKLEAPQRGDVVVFHPPAGAISLRCGSRSPARGAACSKPTRGRLTQSYIQRVVALPGEKVRIVRGGVVIGGRRLIEPYIRRPGRGCELCDLRRDITVPAGHYFVMGDNRGASADSRVFGPIAGDTVIGKARLRYWPLGRFGLTDRR